MRKQVLAGELTPFQVKYIIMEYKANQMHRAIHEAIKDIPHYQTLEQEEAMREKINARHIELENMNKACHQIENELVPPGYYYYDRDAK